MMLREVWDHAEGENKRFNFGVRVMKRKTIADITVEVLKETDNKGIMYGDTVLLDMVAERCIHTTLMRKKDGAWTHPLVRHYRILNALEKDKRFEKYYFERRGMVGNKYWRSFKLKE